MIDELETNDIRWFIRRLHNEYEKNTLIQDWCDVEVYCEQDLRRETFSRFDWIDESEEEGETSFNQIGEWTKMPTSIIKKQQFGDVNINNLVRRITLGERNYIISKLDSHDPIRSVQTSNLTFSEFVDISTQVRNPDHLILPLRDDLRSMRRDWRQSNNYYFSSGEFVVANGEAIRVHWYPPKKAENIEGHGYLVDSDAISIIQKWHGDSPAPTAFTHDEDYDEYSLNRPFMIYFGTEVETDEEADSETLRERVDLLYRTVWSEPDIDTNGVLRFSI